MTKVVQTRKTTLYGSGCTSSATSIVLTNCKLPDGTTNVTMTNFGTKGYATIEPGTAREEQITFTGLTQNVNKTATLTGVTRGVNFVSPYDEISAYKFAHAGGSTVVFSNTAGFYEKFTVNTEDETITGEWSVPTPTADAHIATKKYVDDLALGGSTNIDRIVLTATAGATVAEGNIVYQKVADSEWYKADAATLAEISGVQLGVAQGAGTDGAAIVGGVLIKGKADNFTGLTANTLYYLSDTEGAVATTAGTFSVRVGLAISTTTINVDFTKVGEPDQHVSTSAGAGDSGKGVNLNASGVLDRSFNVDKVTFTPNAGETINGATLPVPVYQNKTDNEVYACDANDATKYKFIGFAITNSTDGAVITVKTNGIVEGFTGLAEGEKYYVSDTVGTIQTTVGTQEILVGIAISETALLIQKGKRRASGTTTFTSSTNTTITCGFRVSKVRIHASGADAPQISMSSGGWTVSGGNICCHGYTAGATHANANVQNYAWYTYLNGANQHNGIIGNITDTTFELQNTEASGSSTVNIYWEAEGEL